MQELTNAQIDTIEKFLEDNIELVDSCNFDKLYEQFNAYNYRKDAAPLLTKYLIKECGITLEEILEYITRIPCCFCYMIDDISGDIIIPEILSISGLRRLVVLISVKLNFLSIYL